jgi:hypothetical protein
MGHNVVARRFSYAMVQLARRPGPNLPQRELLWDGDLDVPRVILHRFRIASGATAALARG